MNQSELKILKWLFRDKVEELNTFQEAMDRKNKLKMEP